MPEPRTKKTDASVLKFISSVKDEKRKADALVVLEVFRKATKAEPKMWGSAIVGFGEYMLKYSSGKELPWPIVAFSPRKESLVLYGTAGARDEETLKKLGKCKTGKGCLYINKMEDVNVKVLEKLIKEAYKRRASPRSD